MGAEHKGSACREYEALFEDYRAGDLEGAAAEQFVAHLDHCGSCREAFEVARLSSRLVRGAREPLADPGPSFARRVMAAIREKEESRAAGSAFWRPLEILALRLALTATMALAFLLGYGLRSSFSPVPSAQPQIVLQQETREIFPETVKQPASRDEVLMSIAERKDGR